MPFDATEDTKMSLLKNLTSKDVVSLAVFYEQPIYTKILVRLFLG